MKIKVIVEETIRKEITIKVKKSSKIDKEIKKVYKSGQLDDVNGKLSTIYYSYEHDGEEFSDFIKIKKNS